jgi:hypothetical protein
LLLIFVKFSIQAFNPIPLKMQFMYKTSGMILEGTPAFTVSRMHVENAGLQFRTMQSQILFKGQENVHCRATVIV